MQLQVGVVVWVFLLVALAVSHHAAVFHGCERNSMDYDQDVAFQGD